MIAQVHIWGSSSTKESFPNAKPHLEIVPSSLLHIYGLTLKIVDIYKNSKGSQHESRIAECEKINLQNLYFCLLYYNNGNECCNVMKLETRHT